MNHVSRKASALENAGAPRPLLARRGGLAVFALQNAACAFQLAFGRNAIDDFLIDTLGLQVVTD